MPPDGTTDAPPGARSEPRSDPPGLREQIAATIDAARKMVEAHVELARAELSEIGDEVKRVAALGGVAAGLFLFLGILLPVGLLLFLGEWWFGSIGWGVLLGTELCLAIAVTCVALAFDVSGAAIARSFLLAVLVGGILAVVLALALPNEGWTRVGNSAGLNVEPGVRPLAIATAVIAAIGAFLGLLSGARSGGIGGAIGGLIGGAILGAIVGALSAVRFGVGPGAALGVALGLGTWAALAGFALAREGIDGEAMKARFWPTQTIETTKETIEWVRERTPLGPRP